MIESARLVLEQAGHPAVARFGHGTTVATNALLERKGARTAFVATEGFEHLLHLRRQDRAHLYRLELDHPEPLVPLERCVGVRERIGPDGIVTPLDARHAARARRGGRRRVPPVRVPRPVARARSRGRGAAQAAPRARRRLARGGAGVPRVRARLHDRRRRVPGADRRPLPPCPRACDARGGFARASRDALVGRRRDARGGGCPSRRDPRLRTGRRRRRDRADRAAERGRERDRVRHGRDVDRRVPGRGGSGGPRGGPGGGGLPDPGADGRHPHGRRGWRLDRLARHGRRAARRAAQRGRRSGPCLLRAGRDGADRDRREPLSRSPAGVAPGWARARPRRRRSSRSATSTPRT